MNTWRMTIAGIVVVVAAGAAACSRPASASDELQHDLDMANSSGGLTMAPTYGGTQVVSSVERTRAGTPTVSASRTTTVPKRVVRPAAQTPVTPVAENTDATNVQAPNPASAAEPAPAPRPTPRQAEPHGGWKSVGEVIRNAPFPITP